MQLSDLFITPLYLFIIYQILFLVRKKECGKSIIKKYFIPAASAKIVGGIALGLVYKFYYKGGDTVVFYNGAERFFQLFESSPTSALMVFFRNCNDPLPPFMHQHFASYAYQYDNQSFFIVKIASFFGMLDFNCYTVTAILFGMVSFSGSWALFKILLDAYPKIHEDLARAVFFIPSVVFWGSGLMKDSITLGALGWFVYGFYFLFIKWRFTVKTMIALLIGGVTILMIKIYILMSMIPALVVWIFLVHNQKIKSSGTRLILMPLLLVLSLGLGIYATYRITEQDNQYKFENLTAKAKVTNEWLTYVSKSQNGSHYDLGEIDYSSPLGLLKVMPKAINVTLFRPYLWEAKNLVMYISALESLYILGFTIFIIMRVGLFNTFSIARNNPMVMAFVIFSLGMSFAVGLTSSNFGTLVRYKIPIMPFYVSALFILRHVYKEEKAKKRQRQLEMVRAGMIVQQKGP